MLAGGFVPNRIVDRPFDRLPLEQPEKSRGFAGTELDVNALEFVEQVVGDFQLRW